MDFRDIQIAQCLSAARLNQSQRLLFVQQFLRGLPIEEVVHGLGLVGEAIKVAQEEVVRSRECGLELLGFTDSAYPPLLRHIADPPLVLWGRGASLAMLANTVCVAIVGSRKANADTCVLARQVSQYLAERRVCIVSGLAYGVDGEAHSASLERAGELPTVAVLGQGLNEDIYPRAHRALAERILERGGILLSQFAPDRGALPSNFLDRNRVIAGLAVLTIVLQAGERSGSLVTARVAAESGRDVLVAPGRMGDGSFSGSNRLIQTGANIFTSLQDLHDFLPDLALEPELKAQQVNIGALANRFLEIIREGGRVSREALTGAVGCHPSDTALSLMELELAGLIVESPGDSLIRLV